MKRRTLAFVFFLCGSLPALSQNVRWDPPTDAAAITTQGTGLPYLVAVPNVTVNFCAYPANAVPCTNKVVTYNGISGSACSTDQQITLPTSSTCQGTSDSVGNWGVYVPAGTYQYTITANGTSYGPFTASVGGSGGGSTITLETNGNENGDQAYLNLLDSGNGSGTGYAYVHPNNGTGTGNVSLDIVVPGFAGQLFYNDGTGITHASGTAWNDGSLTLTLPNLVVSGSCTGCASSSVNSVIGTTNQILNVGSATNVQLAIASPFSFPGNFFATQAANGNNLATFTRNTDSPTPAGNFLLFRSAGLSTLAALDVFGNWTAPSYTATGTGAGYSAWAYGTDNLTNCQNALTAASLTGICGEAPASGTSWSWIGESAAPGATSVETWSTGSPSTRLFTPVSGSSGYSDMVSGTAAWAALATANIIGVSDGNGNLKPSGVAVSSVTQNCNSATITFAVLCGKVDSTGLTGNLSNTNILTASAAQPGQYVLAFYYNATSACVSIGSGSFVPKISYTDSNGSATKTIVPTINFVTTLPSNTTNVISFWLQSATSTINVAGTYTACGSGTQTIDVHYALYRVE